MVGFDARDRDGIRRQLICPVCSLILRDPVQLSICGHQQCQSCVEHESRTEVTCPLCPTETQQVTMQSDEGLKNEIQSLSIGCSFCSWNGIISNYEEHLHLSHPNPTCENCFEQLSSVIALNQHKVFECKKQMVCCTLTSIETDSQMTTNTSITTQLNETYETLEPDLRELKFGIEERKDSSPTSSLNQNRSSEHPTIIDENTDGAQCISYDGTCVWRITNFKEKMRDAQSERQTSIYSPPFYSSKSGYKMCACLYLDGNGIAHRTHMSLFFVLMRSEFDAILQYPFNYKVIFCMCDQSDGQQHVFDSFRPDIISNSFQRPQSEMNIASGIPKFYPLADIQQEGNPYIRDNKMFIRIMVDFGNNIPNWLLPHAVGCNPGLPANIQHMHILQEIERQSQQRN